MKHYILTLSILGLFVTSCSKNLTDYNVDPDRMPYGSVVPESLLQELIMSSSEAYISRSYSFAGNLIQYTVTLSSSISYDRYYIATSSVNSLWNVFYRWAADAEHMRKTAVSCGSRGCEGIALIMKTLLVQTLTDSFGDVPYGEAFLSDEGNKTPVFDRQKDIYLALISNLKRANDLLSEDCALNQPSRDILYGGDMDKWRRFGNSLLLRCYMRVSGKEMPFSIPEAVRDMFENPDEWPLFENNEHSAVLHFEDVEPFVNPLGEKPTFESTYHASEYMINLMTATSDPRLSIYYKKKGSSWKGAVSGVDFQESSWNGVASLNASTLAAYSSPYALMRCDEVYFLLAEAAQSGFISADAGEYYNLAIRSSLDYWAAVAGANLTESKISAFLLKVPYDGTLKSIIDQKHVALFGIGFEAWNEYRRTGYPELKIGEGTLNDHVLPTRIQYPMNEVKVNPGPYLEVLERMKNEYGGDDNMKTPVWWSKNCVIK